MKIGGNCISIALLLAGCGKASPETPPQRPTPIAEVTLASEVLPVNAAFCLSEAVYERYNNTKECAYEACSQGDAEACELAESYNGNLWEDGIPQ